MSAMDQVIEAKLLAAFAPERLSLVNESHQHSAKAAHSHYNAIIVAEAFAAMNRVARQRAVYACLAEELAGGVHALTMKTLTPAEWQAAGGEVSNPAPKCRGGSKSG
jgi:stress-induced morphogen